MSLLGDAIRWLSMACLGVFLGAMLTEGCVLVPYWRSLAPADFFAWYAANDRRLLGFFGPLTSVTAVLAIAAAIASIWQGHSGRWPALVAALLAVAVVSTFFIYFERANLSFSSASISATDLPAELRRWATWHSMRTVLSAVAFAAALLAVRPIRM
jgi:hypothetical protein